MNGTYVFAWLLGALPAVVGLASAQEARPDPRAFERQAERLGQQSLHAEGAVQYEAAARAWENAGKKARAARAWRRAAEAHDLANEYEPALAAAEVAVRLLRELYPDEDDPELEQAVSHVAFLLAQRLERPAEGMARYEQALAMLRRQSPGDLSGIATLVGNVAFCLFSLGRNAEALPLLEESLASHRKAFTGDHPAIAVSLSNFAMCLEHLGRRAEALLRFEEALAMRRRLFTGDHPEVAISLNNVAACREVLGRSSEALPGLEESLAMYERLFTGDHPEVAQALLNVASCLSSLGRNAEALPRHERAVAMLKRLFSGDHPQVALALTSSASCLDSLGRSAEALPRFEEALAMRKRLFTGDHTDVAASASNLGHCFRSLGRSAAALSWFEEALAVEERLSTGDRAERAADLCNLAHCLDTLGRHAEALPRHEEALAMRRRLFTGDHPGLATSLKHLGTCLQSLGRNEEARLRFEEALAMRKRLCAGDHPATLVCSSALAQAYLQARDASSARPLLEAAISMLDGLRETSRMLESADRAAYLGTVGASSIYDLMRQCQLLLGDPIAALRAAEAGRARELLQRLEGSRFDALAEAERRATARGDANTAKAIAEARGRLDRAEVDWGALVHELSRLASDTGPTLEERVARKAAIESRMVAADAARKAAMRERARLVADVLALAQPAPPEQLAAMLREGELLLFFCLDDAGQSCALALEPGDVADVGVVSLPGRRSAVDDSAQQFLALLSRSPAAAAREDASAEQVAAIGRRLAEALLPGELRARIAHRSRVFVVADGALARLPFEALPVGEANGPAKDLLWLDALPPVAYAPSGSVLRWLRQRVDREDEADETHVVALGDPVFAAADDAEGDNAALRAAQLRGLDHIERLPGTRAECEAIARAFAGEDDLERALASPRVHVLLDRSATEANLFVQAPRAAYLHIATHGIADEVAQASFSALALTMPEKPAPDDNGFLDLHDLLHRWRDRLATDSMVVLSACRTAVGPQQKGEAVQALPIGFLHAGASAVIASLWNVSDESTAVLMGDFYRRLAGAQGGRDRLRAFQDARRALRRDQKHADPFHWAAFLLLGTP